MKLHNKVGSFLKFRSEAVLIEKFEKQYGLNLPPIFRSFITEFDGIAGEIYIDLNGRFQTLTYYQYNSKAFDGNDLFFQDFMSIENIFKFYRNSDTWVENGVAPITEHSHGGVILVGIEQRNQDKLYFEYERGLILIEDNIYSFLRNLSFEFDDSLDASKFYKNWGEEFWRLKN